MRRPVFDLVFMMYDLRVLLKVPVWFLCSCVCVFACVAVSVCGSVMECAAYAFDLCVFKHLTTCWSAPLCVCFFCGSQTTNLVFDSPLKVQILFFFFFFFTYWFFNSRLTFQHIEFVTAVLEGSSLFGENSFTQSVSI